MAQKDNCLCDKTENKRFIHVNPWTYMQIHTPTVVQGGWVEAPPRVFDMLQYFETMKAVNGGTARGGCDVINNGHHLGCHLGFYKELEIRIKPQEMAIFLCLR